MDTTKLYQICGIVPAPPTQDENWVKAEMKFIGAEHYVLGSRYVQIQFVKSKEGVSFVIKGPTAIKAEMLLGTKHIEGKLYDVELVTSELTLSLASLNLATYPKVLRRNEVVELIK